MIQPLFDKVLIEIEREKTMTTSGIIIDRGNKEESKLEKAVVLEVGEDVVKLKKGDTILFKAYSADTIKLDPLKDEELSFIKEEDALAIV